MKNIINVLFCAIFLFWWLKMFFLCFHIFFLQEGASFDAYFAAVLRTQYFWYLYRSFYCKIKTIKYMYICIHLFSFHLFFICLKNRCIYGKIKTNSSHMCIYVMSVFGNTNFQNFDNTFICEHVFINRWYNNTLISHAYA